MPESARKPYPTDLSDREWERLKPYIPECLEGGLEETVPRREIVNGILYALRAGCAWRLMPHDLPKWQTVYHYFNLWQKQGVWERANAALRRQVRKQEGRDEEPSASIIDSQTVKTTEKGGTAATTRARR
jgi:transposase